MSTLQIPNNIGSQCFAKQNYKKLEMWRTFTLVQYAWVMLPITDNIKLVFVLGDQLPFTYIEVNRYLLPSPIREMFRFWRRHNEHSYHNT